VALPLPIPDTGVVVPESRSDAGLDDCAMPARLLPG
jgi:hypothetical protein